MGGETVLVSTAEWAWRGGGLLATLAAALVGESSAVVNWKPRDVVGAAPLPRMY